MQYYQAIQPVRTAYPLVYLCLLYGGDDEGEEEEEEGDEREAEREVGENSPTYGTVYSCKLQPPAPG